jgi:hypothetical protein
MSKLIGTDPNQVPSNADLGSAAFMDKKEFLLSKGSDISAIDAVIPKTAVDVFIYDTSKDSDGGAWRKRTQHTSWYNEKLNTTIRGNRREFPSVAVIVATTAGIYIYDGDDPSLPFWRLFEAGYNSYGGVVLWDAQHLSLSALNGTICVGNRHGNVLYGGNGLYQYKLISDIYQNDTKAYSGKHSSGVYSPLIYGSNDTNTVRTHNLVNYSVSDVSMAVLSDAKIDPVTGLPVPTIAVGTYGGIAVIKSDGTTINSSSNTSYPIHEVNILSTGELYHRQGFSNGSNEGVNYNNPYSRISGVDLGTFANSTTFWYATDGTGNLSSILGSSSVPPNCVVATKKSTFHVGDTKGLSNISVNSSSVNEGMVNWVTKDYVTGWMNGDIKLATLSDTDDTDVVGSELVTNGTFDTDVSGWSNNATELLTWNSSGYADIDRNGGSSQGQCYQYITTEIGKSYVVAVDVLAVSHGFQVYYDGNSMPSTSGSTVTNTTGTFYWWFTATNTSTKIDLSAVQSSSGTASVDNVSIKLAESDRSVNNKGLQVVGTITKTPVATGADLVAYSGFSSGNELFQRYNSDLNIGNGDFAIMVWAKHVPDGSNAAYYVFDRADTDGSNRTGAYYIPSQNRFDLYSPSGTVSANGSAAPLSDWSFLTFVRNGGTGYIYQNGRLLNSSSMPESWTGDGTAIFRIGARFNGAEPWTLGSLSLFRLSATAPSEEQIKKIYEDEKMLFQENAKATLYGSSDAVTALAYDDSTNLLHVGTSAGRSVFQGLQRIDNTTNAVGTAISAVDGMVVEE